MAIILHVKGCKFRLPVHIALMSEAKEFVKDPQEICRFLKANTGDWDDFVGEPFKLRQEEESK